MYWNLSGGAGVHLPMRHKFNQMPVVFAAASHIVTETYWRPFADIYRTRTGWLIKYDLAGVRPDDIEVAVQGSEITVSGLRRDWKLEEGCMHYSMEISYNRFERTVELPCEVEGAEIEMECREGILLVRLTCQGEQR
jgi:HSP20 family protein